MSAILSPRITLDSAPPNLPYSTHDEHDTCYCGDVLDEHDPHTPSPRLPPQALRKGPG